MNISGFFIHRPIFAGVLSLMIFMAGLVCMMNLPVAEYPEVAPPTVQIRASYPGATPNVVAQTVAAPLEEQINGVEDMLYMASQSTADGQTVITVTFKLGTDPNKAQQDVQNRVNQALPRLPDITRQIGVTTAKSSGALTMVVHLLSPKGTRDTTYLRNYATLHVRDALLRLPGIGTVNTFGGGDYAMRIWMDPQKLAARSLTPGDVVAAVQAQNAQVAAGALGTEPTDGTEAFQLPIRATGRLSTPEEFGDIILKAATGGQLVRLKDVARVEVGPNAYNVKSWVNNKDAAALAIFQAPNSNAIALSNAVRATMAELAPTFPADVTYKVIYDPTEFVRTSIEKVIHTLVEATLLVVLVVILFLQTWRASLIPLLAVPVSIVGTFAVLYLLGFSINNLTLFGLVLAIGIVVDDAIVVVENVERNIALGKKPLDATLVAMQEVSGPIIAIALTLCAVFLPLAFIAGLTGQFYQQFAVTIAISTVISAFNSLTLSPALAALLLPEHGAKPDRLTRGMDRVLGRFFGWFNAKFKAAGDGYEARVGKVLRRKGAGMGVYVLAGMLALLLVHVLPRGYIPTQDKGYLVGFLQLPPGTGLGRTEEMIHKITDAVRQQKGVENVIAFPGLSISGFTPSSNAGLFFVRLADYAQRPGWDTYGPAIAGQLTGKLNGMFADGFAAVFPPPPVSGLGTIGGFKLQLLDNADLGDKALYGVMKQVVGAANQNKALTGVFSGFEINTPQLFADLDRAKAKALGVEVSDVFGAMQIALGSLYINDFNAFGRTYQVIAQADAPFRRNVQDITNLQVRSRTTGAMIPLGSLLTVTPTNGPDRAMRYNLVRTADINANAGPGFSTGQAQAAMEGILAKVLPQGVGYSYTDLAYQQILAGDTEIYIFGLCIALVFLVLAAQYESLILPLAIIMIVPVVLFCGLFGVWLAGMDNNIFVQIGLIVLVGLACKNAILIVEFARELELGGQKIIPAALEACRLRLRPILMTSFAFIMGVFPLVVSGGAGFEMRRAIGVTVFSGMLGVTLMGLFLTPLFYVLLRGASGAKPLHSASQFALHHGEEDPLVSPAKKGKGK